MSRTRPLEQYARPIGPVPVEEMMPPRWHLPDVFDWQDAFERSLASYEFQVQRPATARERASIAARAKVVAQGIGEKRRMRGRPFIAPGIRFYPPVNNPRRRNRRRGSTMPYYYARNPAAQGVLPGMGGGGGRRGPKRSRARAPLQQYRSAAEVGPFLPLSMQGQYARPIGPRPARKKKRKTAAASRPRKKRSTRRTGLAKLSPAQRAAFSKMIAARGRKRPKKRAKAASRRWAARRPQWKRGFRTAPFDFATPLSPRSRKKAKRLQWKKRSKKSKRRTPYYTAARYKGQQRRSIKAHSKRRAAGKKTRGYMRAVTMIPAGARVAGLVRVNPRTGEVTMSRRSMIVANPRRRRGGGRRRNPSRYRGRRVGNPGFSPSGLIQTAQRVVLPQVAGAAGGFVAGFVDSKFLARRPMLSILSKLVIGTLGVTALRNNQPLALGFAGGVSGSLGYAFAAKMGGGMVAPTRGLAMQGIAELASDDPEIAAMLADSEDLADLVTAGEIADGVLADIADDEMIEEIVEE